MKNTSVPFKETPVFGGFTGKLAGNVSAQDRSVRIEKDGIGFFSGFRVGVYAEHPLARLGNAETRKTVFDQRGLQLSVSYGGEEFVIAIARVAHDVFEFSEYAQLPHRDLLGNSIRRAYRFAVGQRFENARKPIGSARSHSFGRARFGRLGKRFAKPG
jgi:hypothetical protein